MFEEQLVLSLKDNFPAIQISGNLRDYFAGQALAGSLSGIRSHVKTIERANGFAKEAYLLADAMLKAKEVKNA